MIFRSSFAVCASVLLVSCLTPECPSGFVVDGERCVVGDGGTKSPCDPACGGPTPRCDAVSKTCVECLASSECTDPAKPTCDATTHACRACSADSDCADVPDLHACAVGKCVQCNAATEATACGANSCNLATHACTSTPRHSLHGCDTCTASSECDAASGCAELDPSDGSSPSVCIPLAVGGTDCTFQANDPNAGFNELTFGRVDGSLIGVCMVRASCAAYRKYVTRAPCQFDTDCINPAAVEPSAARCASAGSHAGTCTLACQEPQTITCRSPDVCQTTATDRNECVTQ